MLNCHEMSCKTNLNSTKQKFNLYRNKIKYKYNYFDVGVKYDLDIKNWMTMFFFHYNIITIINVLLKIRLFLYFLSIFFFLNIL